MKTETRSRILNEIKLLSAEEKLQKSLAIQSKLQNLLKNENGNWAGFLNLSDEPSIDWADVSKNIEWCFPVVQEKILKFKTNGQSLATSSLGVREPVDGTSVSLNDVQGVVLPAIAFDQQGHRLGRGGGFYDRTLEQYQGKKVGVCFELALCEELPHEAHDIRSDYVVTEMSVYQTQSSEVQLKGAVKWS